MKKLSNIFDFIQIFLISSMVLIISAEVITNQVKNFKQNSILAVIFGILLIIDVFMMRRYKNLLKECIEFIKEILKEKKKIK